jgi:RNA polymerase sigma factor (sigma-70 family)
MPTAALASKTPAGPRAHPPGEDAALVRRMRAGDERAFEAIFKRHHAPLLSYCRHMLGNQDEAEDALQQAFIRAHKALLGPSPPRELRPWLYAITRNRCLSAIAARRPTTVLDDRTPSLAGLSEEVHEREDLRELVADMGRLPEDQRSALLLAELDDLSHQAIATVVGCPVSKVKALVYQARATLIAEREAREASCRDIREQLSVARGGELRRGPLRRHLSLCAGCRDFQHAVATQRQSLAAVLPVLPSAALAARILGHGAIHAAGTAGIGQAGATVVPAGGGAAGGASAVTGGGTGIATAGGTAAGTTAAAGAVSGTSTGAAIGGGLLAKVAVGGAVAALATAGAVAIPPRLLAHTQRVATTGSRHAIQSRIESPAPVQTGASPLNAAFAGGRASAAGPIGPGGSIAAELAAGIGGRGATIPPGLGGASAAEPLAKTGALTSVSTSGSTGRSVTGKKLSPVAHRRALRRQRARRARLRRLLQRRKLLERRRLLQRRLLKRRARLKRAAAQPNPPAAVPPAPAKPAHKKRKSPTPVSTPPSTEPTTTLTGTTDRRKATGHPKPRTGTTGASSTASNTSGEEPTSGKEPADPATGSKTEPKTESTIEPTIEPVGPEAGSESNPKSSAGNTEQGTGTTGAGGSPSGRHKRHF